MAYRTPVQRAALGKRLRDARQDARLTRTELAQQLGVSQSTVQMWEAGQRAPRHPFKVADTLGVDPYWLTGQKKPRIKRATNGTEPQ